jgi:hypothetical protein
MTHLIHQLDRIISSVRPVKVAQRRFDDPHMQEPNILPLFQRISKAESPLSFLEAKRPPGPIRVIIGTAQTQKRELNGLKKKRQLTLQA